MPDALAVGIEGVFDEITAAAAALRESVRDLNRSNGLSLSARAVLQCLRDRPGLTVPQLARQRGSSRQNMQVLVDRLSEAGLVEYTANPDHCRSDRLQLASVGLRSLNNFNRRQGILSERVGSQVSGPELETCLAVLKRVRAALGGRGPSGPEAAVKAHKTRLPRTKPLPPPEAKPMPQANEPPAEEVQTPEEFPINLL